MAKVLYTAHSCQPCETLDDLIQRGKLPPDVEVVDIETDDGFTRFSQEILAHGDSAIPSAYQDGKQCEILIDEDTENIVIRCPPDTPPASPEG